ncbi:glucosaminidase domain-containing protein [Enterococcus sp. 669A]|uniref:Glucosaminidase domain-containing protein n=1 Tax=Candidatus Enterococcus moelleringii TaxID=2815325 RepID=A0ABS3LGX9_9ENTE|nr:glucosaminidase domain-containing protein [Enterococcus sp. 669A]MBO1308885.1 glucosaminidase domain-containing protein [Enterococcus sp. 669A]
MKSKELLCVVLVSGILLSGCQSQVRQVVLAETEASSTASREVLQSEADSLSPAASTADHSLEKSSSVKESSIKEEQSQLSEISEGSEGSSASEVSVETVEVTEESNAQVPEIIRPVTTPEKVEEHYQFSVVKNQTTEEFIRKIGKDAQQIAWDNGLYASVMIAQAILETGSGNSQLSRPPHHNLFGIKGSYQGKEVSFNTQEDKGNGQLYMIKSAFRQYPSYKESLEDYAALLKNGLSGNPGFYQGTWKEYAASYQEATTALTGKYATDTSYDKKLNVLIETYGLVEFDQELSKQEEILDSTEGQQNSMDTTTEASKSAQSIEETTRDEKTIVSKTKQQVVIIPPVTQRPAKQLSGNRPTQ